MRTPSYTFALLIACGCAEGGSDTGPVLDASPAQDAGLDGGSEGDAGIDVDGGPAVRTLVEHHIVPRGDERNQFVAPDFESKLPSTAWIGYDLDPAATQLASIRRSFEVRTPSSRSEVLLIPGTDSYPAMVAVFGYAWVTGTGFSASVWLGYPVSEGEDPFSGQEVTLFGFEAEQGASAVDLLPDPDQVRTIGDVRWQKFSVVSSGRFVGRLMVSVQNFAASSLRVNGPSLRSTTAIVAGRRPRAVSASEHASLSKLRLKPHRTHVPSPLEAIGLPAQLSGSQLPTSK